MSVTTHRLVAAIGAAIALALATACGGAADAGDDGAGDLDVTDVWAAQADDVAAVYLTIANGGAADRLVAASTDAATDVSLMGGGGGGADASSHTAGHVPVDLAIPPGTTSFEPGGRHVMLDGLVQPLRPGDRVPLTLRFERAGARTVDVDVVDWDEVSERLP